MSNDLTLEELLAIAKTPTKEKIEPENDYSDAFQVMLYYRLERGEHPVKASTIYELYRKWKKGKPHGKNKFFKDFANHFEKFLDGRAVQYLLSEPQEVIARKLESSNV